MELKNFENIGRDLRDSILHLLRDYSEALTLAIVMAIILRLFVFSAYKISNYSMEPNLKMGDFVVGYKLPYGISLPFTNMRFGETSPHRGDVLVFRCPDAPDTSCVKRVVGVAGDRIEIKKQRLFVNGQPSRYTKVDHPEVTDALKNKGVVLNEIWRNIKQAIFISKVAKAANFGPYIVPPGRFFVLSDNRDGGVDSRHWGAIPNRHIEARLLFIWLSIDWQIESDNSLTPALRFKRLFHSVN